MPPRRSSRTRASVEPASVAAPSSSGSKRKRGQPAASDETEDKPEKENVSKSGAKPPSSSRARRPPRTSSVGAPSRASGSLRTSGRGRLQEVEEEEQERDEEGEDAQEESDAPRARKKSRKSAEQDEGAGEEDEPPKKAGRAGRTRGARAPAEAEEVREEEEAKPASRARRSSAKPQSSSKTSTRSGRKPVRVESDVEEEASVSGDTLPVPKGRKPAPGRARKGSDQAPAPSEEPVPQQSAVGEEDSAPAPHPRKPFPTTPIRIPSQPIPDGDDGDGLDGFDTSFKGSPLRAKRRDTKQNSSPSQSTKRAVPIVEDEEEHSLLEPRQPKLKPQSQMPLPPPEEPGVQKSRLVIHKMALVNFKSYAGRQEIGPFHKVCLRVERI